MAKGEGLRTRLAVLEALFAARGVTQDRALTEAKSGLERRLDDMNHWRAEEIADKAEFLRSSVYDKSEDLHRDEMARQAARIATLEIRITQVATVGALAVLAAGILSPVVVHFFLK